LYRHIDVATLDSINKQSCHQKLHNQFLTRVVVINMSVFSLDTSHGNPVTQETVDKLCSKLGVTIEEKEKEDYRRLLAVFHDASEQLMAMDGKK
jgi:DNA-binding Xre family transcriptional regulator